MRKVLIILSALADSDIEWLIANGCNRAVRAGTTLIEEERPISSVFVVLEGQLRVSLAGAGDREIARLGSGEIIGELSFLDSRPPSATVTAVESSVVLDVPRAALADKLEHDAEFAARFYRALGTFLATRLRQTQRRLGYGTAADDGPAESADEIDPMLLDQLALAGARFEWMLRRLREAPVEGDASDT